MTKAEHFRMKNFLLLANALSNLIGVCVVFALVRRLTFLSTSESWNIGRIISSFFVPLAILVPIPMILAYERPIRKYLDMRYRQERQAEALLGEVRKRLLNEPFFLIVISFAIWFAGAMIYPAAFWLSDGKVFIGTVHNPILGQVLSRLLRRFPSLLDF